MSSTTTDPVGQQPDDAPVEGPADAAAARPWAAGHVIVVVLVALLYWGTPNVRQPKFRWISVGALAAIVLAALASTAFGFYVGNFGNYEATYGTLAGVIIFLFLINIINTVLLFGAELDAELERGRQLQGGIPAEEEIQLPLRDDKGAIKKAEKQREAIDEAREVRLTAGESSDAGSASDTSGSDTGSRTSGDDAAGSDDAEPTDAGRRPQRGSGGATAVSSEEIAEAQKAVEEAEKAEHKPTNHYPDL